MDDSKQILEAIETSNKAFADFKSANDLRLKALETAKPSRADEINEEMKKAFADIEEQKKTIERMEAKLSGRKGNAGGDSGDEADKEENLKAHRKAFSGYMRKGVDAGLAEIERKTTLDITTPADGGYAVPKVIDSEIEALVVNISPIRSIAKVIQISTSDYHKLVNLRGTASGWVGEATARTATNVPQLADVVPSMGEIYANPQATQQMLDDVFFNAESWLAGEVATEFARAEGAAFCTGDGTTKPKGFLSYTNVATGDATRTFGQLEYVPSTAAGAWPTVSSTVNQTDVVITLAGKVKAAYRANARFVLSKDTLFTMAAFKDNSGRYIFNPISAPNVPPTILGYPVLEAEDMPAVTANSYSVAFGDFMRGYLIVDRIGVRVLRDPFSNKPYIGFYTTKRLGGAVVNSEAIKLLKFSVS